MSTPPLLDPASLDPALVAQLRRMVAEPSDAVYDDAALRAILAAEVVPQPPQVDLHAAAARIWHEKLAALVGAGTYDLSADGERFALSQMVTQYERQIAYHLGRRRVGSARQVMQRRVPGVDSR